MDDLSGEQIRDLFLHAIRTLYGILEAVFLTWYQVVKRDPEIVTVTLQLMCFVQFPLGHIAQEEHALSRFGLAGSIGTERYLRRIIFVVIDTLFDTRRTRTRDRLYTLHGIPDVTYRFLSENQVDILTTCRLTFLRSARAVIEDKAQCVHISSGRDIVIGVHVVDHQLPFVIAEAG